MRFLLFEGEHALTPDRFGIPSPRAEAPEVSVTAHTLCLAPGLAAGRDGTRLGYGGGFYDKFLAREPNHPTIARCYGFQVVEELPTEEFDVPVDCVLWA